MTYNVLGGTLNPAQLKTTGIDRVWHCCVDIVMFVTVILHNSQCLCWQMWHITRHMVYVKTEAVRVPLTHGFISWCDVEVKIRIWCQMLWIYDLQLIFSFSWRWIFNFSLTFRCCFGLHSVCGGCNCWCECNSKMQQSSGNYGSSALLCVGWPMKFQVLSNKCLLISAMAVLWLISMHGISHKLHLL